MTIISDGFDLYNDGFPVTRRWSMGQYADFSAQPGRFGGQGVRGKAEYPLTIGTPSGDRSIGAFGFAYKIERYSTSSAMICSLFDGLNEQLMLKLSQGGGISVFRNGQYGAKIADSAGGSVLPNAWTYIECEYKIDDSLGYVRLWCNGVQVLNVSNLNTMGSSKVANTFGFRGPYDIFAYFDDFYFNSEGTRLGELKIETIRPTADTATKDFVSNLGGANFEAVDDTTTDLDTSYVSSNTVGAKDYYDMGNIAGNPSTIIGVVPVAIARKDDAGTRTISLNIKSDGSEAKSSELGLSSDYSMVVGDMVAVDPKTGAAWTPAGVNAAQLGIEVKS